MVGGEKRAEALPFMVPRRSNVGVRIPVGPSLILKKKVEDGPVGQTSQTPLFRQPNGWKWKSARAQACLEATIRQNDLMRGVFNGCSKVREERQHHDRSIG